MSELPVDRQSDYAGYSQDKPGSHYRWKRARLKPGSAKQCDMSSALSTSSLMASNAAMKSREGASILAVHLTSPPRMLSNSLQHTKRDENRGARCCRCGVCCPHLASPESSSSPSPCHGGNPVNSSYIIICISNVPHYLSLSTSRRPP